MYSNGRTHQPERDERVSESMLELLPSRNTPPFFDGTPGPTAAAAAAASITTAATAISRAG